MTSNFSEYIYTSQKDSLIHSTEKKLYSFTELREGWHYGEGRPIAGELIENAVELHKVAAKSNFFNTDAFPGIDGEVRLTIYYEDDYYEFTLENSGLITFVHELAGEQIAYVENLSLEEAKIQIEMIKILKEYICTSSESFTENIMIAI